MPEQNAHKTPDMILLGDLSRFEFLQWLLPEYGRQDWKEEMVWVECGAQDAITPEEYGWNVTSRWVIPHMTLLVPPEETDVRQLARKKDTTFLIFEGDQFGKDSTNRLMMRLDAIQKESPQCIILLDEKRRRASTDIDLEKDAHAAERQCAEYIRSGRSALWVRSSQKERRNQILRVLNWHETAEEHWKRLMRAGVKALERNLELELSTEIPMEDPFRLPAEIKIRIFEFECEKNNFRQEKSIWKVYTATTEKFLFGKNTRNLTAWAVQIYTDIVPADLAPAMSNGETLWETLDQELRTAFRKRMQNGTMETVRLRELIELAFTNAVNDSGINRAFHERLEKYLEDDVRELLANRLRADAGKRAKNWEEYGNETEL